MPTLTDVLRERTTLAPEQAEWLHLLVGDWQLLSDLSFADLVLWVPSDPDGWLAVAHVRPTTGRMVFFDDLVGRRIGPGRRPLLDQAFAGARIVRAPEPEFRDDMPIREEAIPVVRNGRPLAVLTRHTNLATLRTPSRLELTYVATADALARMIAAGDFPTAGAPTGQRRGAPRVGDGVIRLDGRRDGDLRQPQRRLGDPPAGARRRRRRRVTGPDRHRRAARRVPGRREPGAGGDRPRAVAHRRRPRAARACRCGRSR